MPTPTSVRDLLGDQNVSYYRIPFYQREYTWTIENTNELFDDTVLTTENRLNALLGLVVFVEVDGEETSSRHRSLDVVDGQQRLTTISLFLGIIRSELNSIPHDQLDRGLTRTVFGVTEEIEKLLFRKDQGECKKTLIQFENSDSMHARVFSGLCCSLEDLSSIESPLRPIDKDFLREQMNAGQHEIDAKISWLENSQIFDGRKIRGLNTRKNFMVIYERVRGFAPITLPIAQRIDRLSKLKDTLIQHLTFIVHQTSEYAEAFQLFETLNTRGLDVNASDLIKNNCIREDQANRTEIGELWQLIFEDTIRQKSNKSPVYFLRCYHNSCVGFITKRELYSAFRTLSTRGLRWLRTEVQPEADRFALIMQNLAPITNATSEIKNLLFCLNSTESSQWHTVGLSSIRLLQHHHYHPQISNEICSILREVLKTVIVLELKQIRGSILERKLPEIAHEIHQSIHQQQQSVITLLRTTRDNLRRFRDGHDLDSKGVAEVIEATFYQSNDKAKPILALLRLDSQSQGSAFLELTVEHVHPQKPRNIWPDWDSNSNETNRIGNFISLEGSTNSRLSNGDYSEKKTEYLRVGAPDSFPPDHYLHYSQIDSWTPAIVNDRSHYIANRIETLLQVGDYSLL